MDPISAVSFVGTILQFIDFSSKLIIGTYEIYKSTEGTTSELADVSTVIRDLNILTDELGPDISGNTKHERALKSLQRNVRSSLQTSL
ncbi:hypothetical protein BJY04DRAFT_199201 [Aspergillus karnatakaensis]|uniref:uncharacterized protein n=1 Tax=Aspergillus karnatakaensis TaxID=1810916 RepID=UPI003CCE1C6E